MKNIDNSNNKIDIYEKNNIISIIILFVYFFSNKFKFEKKNNEKMIKKYNKQGTTINQKLKEVKKFPNEYSEKKNIYEMIIYSFQKDNFAYDSTMTNLMNRLIINEDEYVGNEFLEKIKSFIKSNLSLEYEEIIDYKTFFKNFINFLEDNFLNPIISLFKNPNCPDCNKKSGLEIKLRQEETDTIILKKKESEMSWAVKQEEMHQFDKNIGNFVFNFNTICFEGLCNECQNKHSCEFIAKVNEHSQLEILNEKNEEIKKLSIITDLNLNIQKKNYFDLFNNNDKIGAKKYFERYKNETSNLVKRSINALQDKLNNFFKIAEIIMSSNIKNKKKSLLDLIDNFNLLLKKYNFQVSKKEYENVFEKLELLKQELIEFNNLIKINDSVIKNVNSTFRLTNSLNNIKSLSTRYLNDLKTDFYYNLNTYSMEIEADIFKYVIKMNKEYNIDKYSLHLEYIPNEIKKNKKNILFKKSPNRKYIATVDFKTSLIYAYELKNKTVKYIKPVDNFKSNNIIITPENARWVNMNTRIFICGGTLNDKPIKNCFSVNYEYELLENESENLNGKKEFFAIGNNKKIIVDIIENSKVENMIYERDKHSIVCYDNFNVICVSGSMTSTCEIYNYFTKKWNPLPSLDCQIYNSSLFLHNNNVLYLFFGLKAENTEIGYSFSQKIFQLNLLNCLSENFSQKWEIVNYQKDPSLKANHFPNDICLCLSGLLSYDSKNIFIVGGKFPAKNMYSIYSFKFNFEKKNFAFDKEALSKGLAFYESNFIQIDEKEHNLWAFDLSYAKLFYD